MPRVGRIDGRDGDGGQPYVLQLNERQAQVVQRNSRTLLGAEAG